MNVAMLKDMSKNETSKQVLESLSERQRNTGTTDLRRLKFTLIQGGHKLVSEDFNKLFENLQKAGVGSVIYAPNKPPIFKWNYSLKEVSKSLLNSNDEKFTQLYNNEMEDVVRVAKRKARGRPKGSKNIIKKSESNSKFVFVFTTSKGQVLPIDLADAERIAIQVAAIKDQL